MTSDWTYNKAVSAMRKVTGRTICSYCQSEKPSETVKLINRRWCCDSCLQKRRRA